MHFYHFTIIVRDFMKSYRFYTEFVGLKEQLRECVPGHHDLAFLADNADDTQIEIVKYDAPFCAEARGITLCFHTDDVAALHKEAVEKGLNPSEIRNPDPQNKYFYVYDPDGLSVEFKQKLPASLAKEDTC